MEVLDHEGKPLAVMTATEAHRQFLPHRAVLVVVFNRTRKVLLGRRPRDARSYPDRWDLTVRGHLLPGEAAFEGARRLMDARFSGVNTAPVPMRVIGPSADTGFEELSVCRCRAETSQAHPGTELLEASRDELTALAQDFRELFTPMVIHALEQGILG